MTLARFKKTIWDYYAREGRRDLPWRTTRNSYRILISEIMLQQTQVGRVVGFYKNFIKQFPDFRALAEASTPDVLRAWQGLGYNRRALALKRLAKEVIEKYGGRLPQNREELLALPGIGPYTAGALRAFIFNEPDVMIETNIRRVFIHFFFSSRRARQNDQKVTDGELQRYIERSVDVKNPREWYFALMDYGAMLGEVARAERSSSNPNRRSAHYVRQSPFEGSDRKLRGFILRKLVEHHKLSRSVLFREIGQSKEKMAKILAALGREGFLKDDGKYIQLGS